MTVRDADPADAAAAEAPGLLPEDILVVRFGPGANCSSIGSALDVLFLSAVAGSAILVAVAAAMPLKPQAKQKKAGGSAGASAAPPGLAPGETPGEAPGEAPEGEEDDARSS